MLNIVNPLILLVVVASHGLAQPQGPEATVGALYEVISGPAGQKRDWDKFRSLFVEDAKMRVVVKRQGGPHELRTLTLDDYVNRSGPMLEQRGFFEKQIAAKVERYDGLVHLFSTYEARSKADEREADGPRHQLDSARADRGRLEDRVHRVAGRVFWCAGSRRLPAESGRLGSLEEPDQKKSKSLIRLVDVRL